MIIMCEDWLKDKLYEIDREFNKIESYQANVNPVDLIRYIERLIRITTLQHKVIEGLVDRVIELEESKHE